MKEGCPENVAMVCATKNENVVEKKIWKLVVEYLPLAQKYLDKVGCDLNINDPRCILSEFSDKKEEFVSHISSRPNKRVESRGRYFDFDFDYVFTVAFLVARMNLLIKNGCPVSVAKVVATKKHWKTTNVWKFAIELYKGVKTTTDYAVLLETEEELCCALEIAKNILELNNLD